MNRLRSQWVLSVIAILLVVDFFYGWISYSLGWLIPGLSYRFAGTVILALLLALGHGYLWLHSKQITFDQTISFLKSVKEYIVLVMLFIFAAWSRLATLDWDLQHGADGYEDLFIQPVKHMLETGDLNHRFHMYPGLFLYILLAAFIVGFIVAAAGRIGDIPIAYFLKIGRTVVALFSVANVFLTFRLGKLYFGNRVGLLSAALIGFSYLEIYTSQYIRPDVVLETFMVVALLQMIKVVEHGTLRSAAFAGIAVGLATAVKYTGFLAIPALLVGAALASGQQTLRFQRIMVAMGALLLSYTVASPYTFLDLPGFLQGVAGQAAFATDPSIRPAGDMPTLYMGVLARHCFGYPGVILMFVGLFRVLSAPRRQELILLSYLATYLAFFFHAPLQGGRFLLPCLPVLALFAAHGLDLVLFSLASRLKSGVWLAAPVIVAGVFTLPLMQSWRYVAGREMLSVRDEARLWIETNLPSGSRIAVSRLGPSLEGTAFTVRRFVQFDKQTFPVLRHFDFLVSAAIDSSETIGRFREVARFRPRGDGLGHEQVVLQVPESLRPEYGRVLLQSNQLRASHDEANLNSLLDRDRESIWRGQQGSQRQQIVADLKSPLTLGKIVADVPKEASGIVATVRVEGSEDGRHYAPLRTFVLSEPVEADPRWVRLTIFLRSPRARFVRLREPHVSRGALAIAELEVFERVLSPGTP